jgi:outer membrane protein assembly factor BamB
MNKLTGAVLALVLSQAVATAQSSRLYTQPKLPSNADLDRLNLKIGWRAYVPTEGRRDGIFSVQALDNLILVQTVSGTVNAISPADGSTLWRARLGAAYHASQALAYNAHTIFLVQGTRLFALDRKNGRLRWEYHMANAAAAAPVADADHVFVPLGTRDLAALELPTAAVPLDARNLPPGSDRKPETGDEKKPVTAPPESAPEKTSPLPRDMQAKPYSPYGVSGRSVSAVSAVSSGVRSISAIGSLSSARDAFQSQVVGPQPLPVWKYVSESRLEGAPLLTGESIIVTDTNGTTFVLAKANHELRARIPAEAPVSAPLAQYGETAYVASHDGNLYAYDAGSLTLTWRFTAGLPIVRKPALNDDDVYVGVDHFGLCRLERGTGREVWRNREASRFLAANKKFVYAAAPDGRLLVLDRARGRLLGSYDAREFVVPVSNEWTDRLLLASHDGLLLCLHDRDRDYRTPMRMKKAEETAAPKPEAKPPADKGEEKPKDKGEDKPKEKPKEKPKDKGEDKPKEEDKPKDKGEDKPKDKDKPA